MNREYFLNPDALRRVLLEEQSNLPLSHSHALHAVARLYGYKNWNAAAASDLNQSGLKQRAKALRSALGSSSAAAPLSAESLATLCAAVNAIPVSGPPAEERPAVLSELNAQETELLGFLGAGASTAELYELMGTRQLAFPLNFLGAKLLTFSDPERDAFARKFSFVQSRHVTRLAALRVQRPPVVLVSTGLSLAVDVTLTAFRKLISDQDDEIASHTLWVDRQGAIHLDAVPNESTPAQYEKEIDNQMQFRYETFERGCGYLGPKAAEDMRFIEDLLASLQRNWSARAAGYIEAY